MCVCLVPPVLQIVQCGALPVLIQMLRSEDAGVHYEAVGVIGNLVHSSQQIKRQVRYCLRMHHTCYLAHPALTSLPATHAILPVPQAGERA